MAQDTVTSVVEDGLSGRVAGSNPAPGLAAMLVQVSNPVTN